MNTPANHSLHLALYQPDIPQNTGAMMRLAACFGVHLDIIEPCGFPFDDQRLKRVGMDYINYLTYARHTSWEQFTRAMMPRRIVLLTTKSAIPYTDFTFQPDDVLMVGRESAGVPDDVHYAATARVTIPMHPETRSMNVATAAAIVLGEALRQIGGFYLTGKIE